MPPHVFADHPAAQPPERGAVDALITQARRLRGDVDAVRREAARTTVTPSCAGSARCAIWPCTNSTTSASTWRSCVTDHRVRPWTRPVPGARDSAPAEPQSGSLLSRVGSAEWNLLTDEASWSGRAVPDLRPQPGRTAR